MGLQEATFESFDVGLNPSMRSALDQVSRVASGEDWCAVLNGPPGLGKTHLAVAALHASVHPRPGLFFTHIGLLTWIRKRSFGEDARDTEDDVLMFFQTNPALVVLDDLGTAKQTEWAQQTLFAILNGRYENRLPTILTLNSDFAGDALDERLQSRFYAGGVECVGDDVRIKGASA